MPLDHDAVLAAADLDRAFSYGERDVLLYALAVGAGADPMDEDDLRYVYEGGAGPATLPTLAVTLARSDLPRTLPINYAMVLHGEQRLTLHRPLPPCASLLADTRITDVIDKGEGRGALISYETAARTAGDARPLFTTSAVLFARGDGGFGGPARSAPRPHPIPDRAADLRRTVATRPDQALLYRLTGDRNPLHADPQAARAAGFARPILHGLCTYGVACRAVAAAAFGGDAGRIGAFDVRFTSPVYPGETLETELWIDGDGVSFRCRAKERDVVVLNNGRALPL